MPPEMFNTVHECTKSDSIKRIEDICSRILNLLNPQDKPEDGMILKVNTMWDERSIQMADSRDTKKSLKNSGLAHLLTGVLSFIAAVLAKKWGLI